MDKAGPACKELRELRAKISNTDKQLFALYFQRMALAKEVAKYKAQNRSPIRVPKREDELVAGVGASAPLGMASYAQALMLTLLRLSRQRQYQFLVEADSRWTHAMAKVRGELQAVHTVGVPGPKQSYSGQAATQLYPHASLVSLADFASACRQVVEGNVDVAVLPLENSTAGTVEKVYSLLEKHELSILASLDMQIHHSLLAIPGSKLANIRRVLSHPQALSQCSAIISGMGWETEEAANTAAAARTVKERGDPCQAALASPIAAAAEGIAILLPQASNTLCNQTRFVALGRTLTIPANAERASILVQTTNETGALAHILNIFADLGIPLVKIQSRPIPRRPWEYSYYIDFMASPDSLEAWRALYQIEQESVKMRILGWYTQGAQV